MHTADHIDLIHRTSIHSRHRLPATSIPTAGPRSRQLHDARTQHEMQNDRKRLQNNGFDRADGALRRLPSNIPVTRRIRFRRIRVDWAGGMDSAVLSIVDGERCPTYRGCSGCSLGHRAGRGRDLPVVVSRPAWSPDLSAPGRTDRTRGTALRRSEVDAEPDRHLGDLLDHLLRALTYIAVRHLSGILQGEGEQGRGWGRRGVDRGVRGRPEEQPCLQDCPVPLEVACPAVEGEGQQAVGPAVPTEVVAPLDLVASKSVPPDEVVQSAGTRGGAHRRHQ
jgi:hypothetical protein